MPFIYDFKLTDGYLLVESAGTPQSPEEFLAYIKAAVQQAHSTGTACVLFDETNATMKFDVYDAVLMSDTLDSEGLQHLGIRAAVICNSHDLAACKYFETSLRNRAFNVMMFDSLETGRNWLLKREA